MKRMQGDSQFYASFTDLLALLLVFFIYLTSMNSMAAMNTSESAEALDPEDFKPVEVVEIPKPLRELVLEVEDRILFPLGEATLNHDAKLALNELAGVVIQSPVRLVIAGHTDTRPISRDIIESNWHLSALRAASVANYLQSQGVPTNYLQIIGHAATDIESDRQHSLNRRVEIRLEQL